MKAAVIGLGRMGVLQSRLARHFGDELACGVDVLESARGGWCVEFGGAVYGGVAEAADALAVADVVWVTVTDGQIASVASELVGRLKAGCCVFHTSGALSSRELSVLSPDVSVASVHPLASCPAVTLGDAECVGRYRGVCHVIEGDGPAVTLAEALVLRFGGRIARIDVGRKAEYHAAAVIASNYPVTLADLSQKMLIECGFDELSARDAVCGLLESALVQLRDRRPVDALTGPVKRRDAGTIALHREALRDAGVENAGRVYEALLRATAYMVGWKDAP